MLAHDTTGDDRIVAYLQIKRMWVATPGCPMVLDTADVGGNQRLSVPRSVSASETHIVTRIVTMSNGLYSYKRVHLMVCQCNFALQTWLYTAYWMPLDTTSAK